MDQEEGMSRQEFANFEREIPKVYGEALKEMRKKLVHVETLFDLFDEDHDGKIDVKELNKAINQVIKFHRGKQKQKSKV